MIGMLTIVSLVPTSGIMTQAESMTKIMERIAVTSVRHSLTSSFKLMVVPIEKTMKSTDHLPISARPAAFTMSSGIRSVMKPTKKRRRLTKTAESFAFVSVPRKSPIPKKRRQRKR